MRSVPRRAAIEVGVEVVDALVQHGRHDARMLLEIAIQETSCHRAVSRSPGSPGDTSSPSSAPRRDGRRSSQDAGSPLGHPARSSGLSAFEQRPRSRARVARPPASRQLDLLRGATSVPGGTTNGAAHATSLGMPRASKVGSGSFRASRLASATSSPLLVERRFEPVVQHVEPHRQRPRRSFPVPDEEPIDRSGACSTGSNRRDCVRTRALVRRTTVPSRADRRPERRSSGCLLPATTRPVR